MDWREEFELVLAIEEKAAWIYGILARDCDDPEGRRLLLELAKDERAHARAARRLVALAREWDASLKKSEN